MGEGEGTVTLELSPTSVNGNLPLFMDPFAGANRISIAPARHLSSTGILNVLVQKITRHE